MAQPSDKFELQDVFNLEHISDPQISPDGNKIIYVRNFKDIMTDKNHSNLWIINYDGMGNRPLTTGNQNDTSPRWSPDGNTIVYMSNKSGNTQIYLRWMDTHSESRLTNLHQSPGAVTWSPDGKQLAFTMFVPKAEKPFITLPGKPDGASWNQPPKYIDKLEYRGDGRGFFKGGYNQLFTISTDGGTPRQVSYEEFDHGAPAWSKDGNTLFFSANMHENREFQPLNSEIYSIDLSTLTLKQLTQRNGPDTNPLVSPDGGKIAFAGFDDNLKSYQLTKLYTMDLNGSNVKMISGDFNLGITNFRWSPDGKGFYIQYEKEGETKISFLDLKGKTTEVVGNVGGIDYSRPYSGGTFSVAQNGRYAFTLTGPYHPADLAVGEKGSAKRLTALNNDLFQFKKLAKVEEIWYESSFDNRQIQGWYVTPPDFDPKKKYPLILEIHGGPFANYGNRFASEMQLYAAAGYVVLYTNPRGSTGYGEEFANLIHHNYPSQDYDDLMSGVDAMIAKGFVNEDQLFVTGGSGGGVLTAWIVGKTDRFKAAVVAKPVINWYSFVLYSDYTSLFYKYWFPDVPWNNPEHYHQRSPISLVANVKTPTMLLTGEDDHRTPIAESEQYYTALKLNKVDAAMVRIPGASHGIAAKPSNLMAKVASVLEWFGRYRESEIAE